MSTTINGALSLPSLPPAPTSPSLAKRKRTETDVPITNGASPVAPTKLVNGAAPSLQTALEDMISILKSYDTEPSILAHPVTSPAARAASGEADTKRAKLSSPASPSNIITLVQNGAYTSLEAFAEDVEEATADILACSGVGELATAPPTLEETQLQSGVLAFRKLSKSLVAREEIRRAHVETQQETQDGTPGDTEGQDEEASTKVESPESRTVLTLFGSAQGPKQLFSSLQQPRLVAPHDGASALDLSVKIALPLRESTLPNIISTTEVFPLPDDVDDKRKANATIGKVFKAPTHLPQLNPPKLAKALTTKGNVVTFAPPEVPKPSRKGSHSYATQNLATSNWLGYGGADMPKDPTSPNEKKKSRQRALSMGEAQQPPSESTLVAVKQAKEDALFRSAYSSFAPSRDDTTAVVPEETKNMVWWQKVGEKRFNEVFPIDPELLGLDGSSDLAIDITDDNEEEAFQEAVDTFEPVEGGLFADAEAKTELDKDTEDVLHEISELLETLASHQRIRNSSLATNSRTPVIQNSSLASLAGSPSTPSSDEIDVYQMLKSQLTLMISQLPPYAVAKLNGDQLEELNISRTLIVENRAARGVLEDTQSSRLATAPVAAPAATPTLNRMVSSGSGTHSHYPPGSTQYGRSTPSMHTSARPVQSGPNYYPQQQSVARSPSMHYQRSSSGSQVYQAPTSSYATPRPSFPAAQAYGQQTTRTSFTQNPPGQYYSQRSSQSSNYAGAQSQFYGSTPQGQPHNRYSQPTQNGYYQRSQNVAPMYGATPNSQTRTASPLKAAPSATQPSYGARPGHGSGGQMRSTYYPPSQYGNTQPHTPVAPSTTGISTNPQQMMLDRQQAQQTQARLAAQNSFSRQGSGTPQPPPNGQYGGQANGTPMAT
ncbi:uncharacterized protein N0V89_009722 [Didymosphaeria variabile]|uniref:Uncharacterized protein n=1 Tax=Didymosphaeria variabile TaxID=1932322 RepID=A0A9W8XDW3_9PLEO|nr:uncharacterized protein N0V89_009722 [Didymosphaeria variabile]KAJ4348348.1 hypothetical protein N0V89_009722 [Didymosphaeria variabile]